MKNQDYISEGMEVVNEHGAIGVVVKSIWNFTDAPYQVRRSDGYFVPEVREDGTTPNGITTWRKHNSVEHFDQSVHSA